jgi:hypothetical protein
VTPARRSLAAKKLNGDDVAIEFTPYSGQIDGIFGPLTHAPVIALQKWAVSASPDGVVGDDTWFIWLTPGSAQQRTLEGACGLTNGLIRATPSPATMNHPFRLGWESASARRHRVADHLGSLPNRHRGPLPPSHASQFDGSSEVAFQTQFRNRTS